MNGKEAGLPGWKGYAALSGGCLNLLPEKPTPSRKGREKEERPEIPLIIAFLRGFSLLRAFA